MKVLVAGGGSGGHVTPVLAVVAELRRIQPDVQIVFVTPVGDASMKRIVKTDKRITIRTIRTGKLRRFHGLSLAAHLSDLRMVAQNVRDMARVPVGAWQSWRLLGRERPDVVFIKGGYVGLPVGIAAHWRRIPMVTHDSDALAGLTNRIVSRWAKFTAVTMPAENYPDYPAAKLRQTGLPVMAGFAKLAVAPVNEVRRDLDLPLDKPLVLVVAGSLGAQKVNDAVLAIAPQLIEKGVGLVHITGQAHFEAIKQMYQDSGITLKHVKILPFVDNLPEYTRSCDVIVTRAGSMLVELAVQKRAVISVPNPLLTGGHQLKNAQMYAAAKAIVEIDEEKLLANPGVLLDSILDLLASKKKRDKLGRALYEFYRPQAAHDIAQLLIEAARKG